MIGECTPTDYTTDQIAANIEAVRRRMADAATRAGRDPADVLLVAVSKMHPLAAIEAAVAAGQREFGENRLEELWPKVAAAGSAHLDLIWHFIGTIQSRKTAEAVGPWALIHSVDRAKIAQRLSRDAIAAGQVLPALLEVNVSGEASKHGFSAQGLLEVAGELAALPGIRILGLMTMAPFVDDAEKTRPVFRALRQLRDELTVRCPQVEWRHLSMGMTNDFEVAIEEGATIIRVGSAIFGARG
jgi:pyridoxal phosphate enzyme (YggS family)